MERPIYCPGCSRQERQPVVAYKVAVPHDADVPESREDVGGEFHHTDGSECDHCGRPIDPIEAPNREDIQELIEDQRHADSRRREKRIEKERRTTDSGRVDRYIKDE